MGFVELYLIFLSTVITFLSVALFKLLIKEKKEKRKKQKGDHKLNKNTTINNIEDEDKDSIRDTLDILNKDATKLDRMASIVTNSIDLSELAKKIISEAQPVSKKEKDRKIIEEALK